MSDKDEEFDSFLPSPLRERFTKKDGKSSIVDLRTIPQGAGSGLDADTVRGQVPLVALDLIGYIFTYGGSTAPKGTLECDGSAVSRTTFKRLFNIIGTTYGVGDGSTTFNLPNIAGSGAGDIVVIVA